MVVWSHEESCSLKRRERHSGGGDGQAGVPKRQVRGAVGGLEDGGCLEEGQGQGGPRDSHSEALLLASPGLAHSRA